MSECEKSPRGRHVASFSGRCRYCGWVPPRRKSDAELLVLAERKIKSLTARLAEAQSVARTCYQLMLVPSQKAMLETHPWLAQEKAPNG